MTPSNEAMIVDAAPFASAVQLMEDQVNASPRIKERHLDVDVEAVGHDDTGGRVGVGLPLDDSADDGGVRNNDTAGVHGPASSADMTALAQTTGGGDPATTPASGAVDAVLNPLLLKPVENGGREQDSGQGSPDSHKDDAVALSSSAAAASAETEQSLDDGTGDGDEEGGYGALDALLGGWTTFSRETSPSRGDHHTSAIGEAGAAVGDVDATAMPSDSVVGVSLGVGVASMARMSGASMGMSLGHGESLSALQGRLEARQASVEARLADARAQLARQQALTSLWLSARTSNPAELWHVPDASTGLAELQSASRRLKARTAALLLHRKRSRNGRAARHTAREVQRMIEEPASCMDPDATDSSSCNSSESEAEADHAAPAIPQRDRKRRRRVQSMWDSDRLEVGWRWNWLDLRLRVTKQGIAEYAVLEEQLDAAAKNSDVAAEAAAAVPETCARVRPLPDGFVRRKLVKDRVVARAPNSIRPVSAPLDHSDRNAIRARSALLDRSFHVVLSFPSDAPHSIIGRARAHRRMLRQQALQRQKQLQLHLAAQRAGGSVQSGAASSMRPGVPLTHQQLARHQQRQAEGRKASSSSSTAMDGPAMASVPTGTLKTKREKRRERSEHRDAKSDKSSDKPAPRITVSVIPVETDPASPSLSHPVSPIEARRSSESLHSRRKKKEMSSIDDVVMPAMTPSRFEPLVFKEILTPSWRVSGSNTPNSGDVSRVSSSSDSSLFAAMMEGAPPPKIDEEGEEDSGVIEVVTDEEYIARHTPCELQEQQRALGIVSETGQRSSVSAGDGEHEARPRDHSKGPSSTLVKLIENRASSVQTNAGFPPRRFPLTDEDLADVQAQLDAPIEVYPLLSDLEAAEEAELATPSVMASSATAEETEDKPEKPIKMIFKMRVVPDDNTQDDDGDDADADDDDDDDDDDDVDGDADADNDGTANAAE